MSVRPILFAMVFALAACGGGNDADTNNDTNSEAGTDATGNTNEDASVDDGSLLFKGTVVDGGTGQGIEGGELCVVEPEQDGDSCGTTDANGQVEWRWLAPIETNITRRFTRDGHTTMLYPEHYNETKAALWAEEMETVGKVSTLYKAFTTSTMEWWLGTGNITMEEGKGQIFVIVDGALADTDLTGLTAGLISPGLSDGGGTVVYWGSNGSTLDPELTASSTTGSIVVANLAPGTHTLNIVHDSMVCDNFRAWLVDAPDVYSVPVEADTVTVIYITCGAE